MTFAGCVSVQVLLLVDTWYDNKACQFALRKIRFIFPQGNLHRYGSTYGFITFSSDLSIPDISNHGQCFYLTWCMVLSLFFNINIFCTVILQHGRFNVWIIEIDINIFFPEAKS